MQYKQAALLQALFVSHRWADPGIWSLLAERCMFAVVKLFRYQLELLR
jgi:hypothetical protein